MTREWLETDGLGGFAMGTVDLARTRRYHALLIAATKPPAGRYALFNGFDAHLETDSGTYAISSQRYPPNIVHPDGARRIDRFELDPWPRWTFALENGARLAQELFIAHGAPCVAMTWRIPEVKGKAILHVRPFFSGRDYHALHHENPSFNFEPRRTASGLVVFEPYAGLPDIAIRTNGSYEHAPDWYRRFFYSEEFARGLDYLEDLASPGVFRFDLAAQEGVFVAHAGRSDSEPFAALSLAAAECMNTLRTRERARRARLATPLERAADAYVVTRGAGKTIVAGYPWFTDWGRDTFISVRGLCLATGRIEDAYQILREWAGLVSEGMLPNRFPDDGGTPEYNAADASLWYVIALYELFAAAKKRGFAIAPEEGRKLVRAVDDILSGYANGTRFGIRADADGLIAAGEAGVQLTWMDAKVGDWVVTPRIGKPVEIQALWLNALLSARAFSDRWEPIAARGREAFVRRFWDERRGWLADVADADHVPGRIDVSFRPNQIFAVGGLPFAILEGDRARRVVDAVEQKLLTPIGLRSLAPGEMAYAAKYEGGVRERDGAYHQGTVWPWLLGPFVEAWVRVRGNTTGAKEEARRRFLEPLLGHVELAGVGHLAEIADAEPPHTPRGCPFQAWSVAEALRLDREVLR